MGLPVGTILPAQEGGLLPAADPGTVWRRGELADPANGIYLWTLVRQAGGDEIFDVKKWAPLIAFAGVFIAALLLRK